MNLNNIKVSFVDNLAITIPPDTGLRKDLLFNPSNNNNNNERLIMESSYNSNSNYNNSNNNNIMEKSRNFKVDNLRVMSTS